MLSRQTYYLSKQQHFCYNESKVLSQKNLRWVTWCKNLGSVSCHGRLNTCGWIHILPFLSHRSSLNQCSTCKDYFFVSPTFSEMRWTKSYLTSGLRHVAFWGLRPWSLDVLETQAGTSLFNALLGVYTVVPQEQYNLVSELALFINMSSLTANFWLHERMCTHSAIGTPRRFSLMMSSPLTTYHSSRSYCSSNQTKKIMWLQQHTWEDTGCGYFWASVVLPLSIWWWW